jgi:hypothetical protein
MPVDSDQGQHRLVEQAIKGNLLEKAKVPLDLSSSEMASALIARVDAVARIYALLGENSRRARSDHADTVIDRARFVVASGDAASLQSALRTVDLLSFELCDE